MISKELCGHSFAVSTISAINKGLDEGLTKFAQRRLVEPYPVVFEIPDGGHAASRS